MKKKDVSLRQIVDRWQEFDRTRPDLPGERWVLTAVALGLLVDANRTEKRWAAALEAALGGALLVRALVHRRGAPKLLIGQPDHDEALREDARRLGLD